MIPVLRYNTSITRIKDKTEPKTSFEASENIHCEILLTHLNCHLNCVNMGENNPFTS